MPELPEVETTRRTLEPALGLRVGKVVLRTPSYVHGDRQPQALLSGCRLIRLERWGKELLLTGRAEPCKTEQRISRSSSKERAVVLHLGMSGSLSLVANNSPLLLRRHVHVIWCLGDEKCLMFHDPRRFGGVWTFANAQGARRARWERLGPDALEVEAQTLHNRLQKTRRSLKATLLDQHIVAGLGNIYVDESLHRAGLSPLKTACDLTRQQTETLAQSIREVLIEALVCGGSTLRDYVNGRQDPGRFQLKLKVYGRGGTPCVACGQDLHCLTLAGRTTVYCPNCQH